MDLQTQDLEPRLDFDFASDSVPTLSEPRARRHLRLVAVPDFGDEDVLLAALRRGDEAAFAHLVASQRDRMLAVARRILPEEEDARDAVQEAFLAAHRAIDGFEGSAKLSTWLHRVVVNACLMRLRSRRRKPERSLAEADLARLATPPGEAADRALEVDETKRFVRDAIAALPEPHRSVLTLRDLEERDTRETAALLGVSAAAVKTRLHRARILLRSQLSERHPDRLAHAIARSA